MAMPSMQAKSKARASVALGHHHHALSMASATHLKNQGYMTAEHAEAVHMDARKKIAGVKKGRQEEMAEPQAERAMEMRPYGSPASGY